MNKLYIGLSTYKGWAIGSELIKWGENTPYSHAYIRRKSINVGEYVYHATANGVNFMGIDIFKEKNDIIEEYEFEITKEQTNELIKFFIKNAGRKYGFKHMYILFKYYLAKKIGMNIRLEEKIDKSDDWVCSVLVSIILDTILLKESIPDNYVLMTPKHLNPFLEKCGIRVI